MNEKDIVNLIVSVFTTNNGKALLEELEKELSSCMFDTDSNKVYYRIGQLDLVRRWKSILENKDSILQSMEERENEILLSETGEM